MTLRRASCVATVTSDGYELGTAVLLTSLVARNPNLDASFMVLHEGLGVRASRLLSAIPGVELVRVGEALSAGLDDLRARHPELSRWATRFCSLEAFALEGFERVLFLDGDVLCVGDLGDLLSRSEGLHACPDRARRGGGLRDEVSFLPVLPDEVPPEAAIRTFNAGVMLIGGDLLAAEVQGELLARLSETDWSRVRSGHTDQYVLNRVFRDRWQSLPERYNRFVAPEGSEELAEEDAADSVFLHFVGRTKPWTGRVGPDWRRCDGARRRALREWDRARLRWALRWAWRGDPRPLLDVFRREGLRLGARILRKRAPARRTRTAPLHEPVEHGRIIHG